MVATVFDINTVKRGRPPMVKDFSYKNRLRHRNTVARPRQVAQLLSTVWMDVNPREKTYSEQFYVAFSSNRA